MAAFALPLFVTGLAAQQEPGRWRVLDARTRLPVPGVSIVASTRPSLLREDSWLALDDQDRRYRIARDAVRSDPDGYLNPAPIAGDGWRASAPFTVDGFDSVEGERVVLVSRQEQYNVLVVDEQGRTVPDFPVALVSSRRQIAVGWSDARGQVTLAMPPEHEARVTIAPAGWIGPVDGFPTLAKQFSRARIRLVVPPHGSIRLAATRHDRETTATIRSFWCTSPHYAGWGHGEESKPARGVELNRVALGLRIHCGIDADRRRYDVVLAGPTRAGEVVTHRVELAGPAPVPAPPVQVHPSLYATFELRLAGADAILVRQLQGRGIDPRGRDLPFWPDRHHERDPDLLFVNMMVWEYGPHVVTLRLHGVELARVEAVPLVEKTPRDGRLMRLDVRGHFRTVSCRFVDREGVPIEGVWLSFFAGAERTGYVLSDRAGRVEFALPCETPPRMLAWSDTVRPLDVTDPRNGSDIVVEAAERWPVSIHGLPDRLPLRRFAIELCPVEGDRFEAISRTLLVGGEAHGLTVPMRGRYWLQLVEVLDPSTYPLVRETVVRWPHELDFGAAVPATVTLRLDESAIARLRRAVPPSGR